MTIKNLTALLALGTLFSGCELIEMIEDGDTSADDAAEAEPGVEAEPEGAASVRFINVADGSGAQDLTVSCDAGDDVSSGGLYFSQGTGYLETAAGDCTISSDSDSVSAELIDGGSYSVAVLRTVDGGTELIVREDDLSVPAADHARINFVHARPFDGDLVSQIYYGWGGVDQEWFEAGGSSGTYFISPGDSDGYEYPYAAEPVWMFNQWGVPTDEAQVALEIEPFIQAGNNEVVDVYVTCLGECAPEDAFVLGHFADGSTATTEGCEIWEDGTGFVSCDSY